MTRSFSRTMKSTAAVAFLTLLTIASAATASAQQLVIQGKIPFNFTVGDKILPAGDYVVFPMGNHVVKIQTADGQNWAIVAGTKSSSEASGGSGLEFDRIGDSYFLHRVLCRTLSALNVDVALGQSAKAALERQGKRQTNPKVLVAMK